MSDAGHQLSHVRQSLCLRLAIVAKIRVLAWHSSSIGGLNSAQRLPSVLNPASRDIPSSLADPQPSHVLCGDGWRRWQRICVLQDSISMVNDALLLA